MRNRPTPKNGLSVSEADAILSPGLYKRNPIGWAEMLASLVSNGRVRTELQRTASYCPRCMTRRIIGGTGGALKSPQDVARDIH
jgi:hypothetical protein